ncbi:MAG: GH1 family beta-glucosidase [Actinomycetaceae bacterium]|nr:GH1 family beta-glucosidase [Actinomycetaceae bacterium]
MRTLTFPDEFMFGAATAAFQIEGGDPDDGRGRCIWDAFCEQPGRIDDGSNGLVACDHYHRMPEDVALMKSLGLQAYRFSTAWSRVIPDGRTVNPKGIDFYSRLTDELLEAGITPWVTLYHWEMPEILQAEGGWTNRDISYRFADLASVLVDALGDRITYWTTLNEPWCAGPLSYAAGIHPPAHISPREGVSSVHHMLLGHGLAIQAMRAFGGDHKLGVTLSTSYSHPADPDNPDDVDAARRVDGAFMRMFLDPIFRAEYPADVLEDMKEAGLGADSRDGDMGIISTPIDFLGINFYNGSVHAAALPGAMREVHVTDDGYPISSPVIGSEGVRPVFRDLPVTAMGWEVNADDLELTLKRLHNDYLGPAGIPVYITENGAAYDDVADEDGFVDDSADRLAYIRDHIIAVHRSIEAGVDVRGYLAWSLLDNFEWTYGYTKRFGIVRVDYDTMKRTPKASALWYSDVARSHRLTIEEED